VHVEYLARHLAGLVDVVFTASVPRARTLWCGGYEPWEALAKTEGTLCASFSRLAHGWRCSRCRPGPQPHLYANFAGYLARVLYQVPTL